MTDEIEQTAQQLERSARDNGMFLSGDLRVSEADAANLLGLSAEYMRQLRSEGKAPSAYKAGVNGSRFSYRLYDLSRWIESRREPELTGVTASDSAVDTSHARESFSKDRTA